MGRAQSPAVLVLCKAALALLVAIPLVLALVGFFGVVVMRVGASPRHGADRNPLPTEERPSDPTLNHRARLTRTRSLNFFGENFLRRKQMESCQRFNLAAALLVTLVVQLMAASGRAAAAIEAPCEMRLRVELGPEVRHPADAGVVSSLIRSHSAYRLTLRQQDLYDSSVIIVDLMGPAPEAGCREVVDAMRKDPRVVSVEMQPGADNSAAASPVTTPLPVSSVQAIGVVEAGPDGDWVLDPLNTVSYVRKAKDRYECDIWAVEQTGFDPVEDNGGVPPDTVPGKRADYLRAEAACFEARGYVVKPATALATTSMER